MKEKVYEELCHNYRFFLTWRHAAFAGNILALGGTIALSISAVKADAETAYLIPLFASPIGFFLWLLDLKIRRIYRALYKSGEDLEGKYKGYFKSIKGMRVPLIKVSHSSVLNIVYWSSSLGLIYYSYLIKGN